MSKNTAEKKTYLYAEKVNHQQYGKYFRVIKVDEKFATDETRILSIKDIDLSEHQVDFCEADSDRIIRSVDGEKSYFMHGVIGYGTTLFPLQEVGTVR